MLTGNARRGVLVVAAALLVAACGAADDTDQADDTGAGDDAAVAAALCGALRDQTNVLVRIANRAVAGITAKSPTDRFVAVDEGFVAAGEAAQSFEESFAALDLPAVPEVEDLRRQVLAGAAGAVDELADEQARFEATGDEIGDADTQGRVGEFFNSIEKVLSIVEPSIAGYERRPLQQAFLDEPDCRHVIQPFRLDD